MADTKITALGAASSIAPGDALVVVNVADTTMAASGTTKRVSPAVLAAGLPVFGASGGSHAAGLVPDPGPTAGTTKFLCESGGFAVPAGSGGGTPGGSTGQLQYNNAGAFGGAADWSIGAAGQLTGTPIADPGSPAAGDLWISSGQKTLSHLNSGCVTRGGGLIYASTAAFNAITNTTAPSSLLAGGAGVGSLVIPANSLVPGKMIRTRFYGNFSTKDNTANMGVSLWLGSTAVISGTPVNAVGTASNYSLLSSPGFDVIAQAVGAAGKVLGAGALALFTSVNAGWQSIYFSSGGGTIAQVTVDTTVALTIDLKITWNLADPANSIRILGFVAEILG